MIVQSLTVVGSKNNQRVIEAYLGDPKLAEKLMQQANE